MKNVKKAILRNIVRLLDRRGLRWLLAVVATYCARRITGKDVAIFYDDFWIHRVGDRYLSDSESFNYYASDLRTWGTGSEAYANDAEDYWFYRYAPKAGDVIVDVGAGLGAEVRAFSKAVGPKGRVLAVEAHPRTFLGLVKTCKWNRLENVICEQVAIMDEPGVVTIEDSDEHLANAAGGSRIEGFRVPSTTVDLLCDKHHVTEVDFLKVNIEGAERWALPGMAGTLGNTHRIAVACHDFRAERGDGDQFATLEFVRGYLREKEFVVETRASDPRPYVRDHVHAWRTRGATKDAGIPRSSVSSEP